MARFLLEMNDDKNPVQTPVSRVSVKPRSLSPPSPLSSSPSPPSSPIHFSPTPAVKKLPSSPPVVASAFINAEQKSVMKTAKAFQQPKSDSFWNYSEKPKPKSKFSFKRPVNGQIFIWPYHINHLIQTISYGPYDLDCMCIFRSDGNAESFNWILFEDELYLLSEF